MGYTLVPELSVIDTLNTDAKIKRFDKPEPSREISMVVHQSFNKEAILEMIKESILQNTPSQFSKAKTYNRIKWR